MIFPGRCASGRAALVASNCALRTKSPTLKPLDPAAEPPPGLRVFVPLGIAIEEDPVRLLSAASLVESARISCARSSGQKGSTSSGASL